MMHGKIVAVFWRAKGHTMQKSDRVELWPDTATGTWILPSKTSNPPSTSPFGPNLVVVTSFIVIVCVLISFGQPDQKIITAVNGSVFIINLEPQTLVSGNIAVRNFQILGLGF